MPILDVTTDSGTAFRCGIKGWFETPKEKHEWQYIVIRVLQYAFSSRSATLITASPMEWSLGYTLPKPRNFRVNQNEYLINYIEQCSPELLVEVADSEDFQRGLLWLSALCTDDEVNAVASALQATIITTGRPTADFEVLTLLDDSRWLCWLHPNRDIAELENEVRNIAKEFGWQVSA